jgi:crotonobetainyl-CoA:carnitine CoA-transferase CaiB-like acyl-CoA transferase
VVEVDHAVLGKIPIVSRSIKYPQDRQPPPAAPPALGQHTDEILEEILGLTAEQIEALRAAKVVA